MRADKRGLYLDVFFITAGGGETVSNKNGDTGSERENSSVKAKEIANKNSDKWLFREGLNVILEHLINLCGKSHESESLFIFAIVRTVCTFIS